MTAMWALVGGGIPAASAQPCPDVEAVFARGTSDPPGVAGTGQAFVNTLRSQVGPRSLGVYAVNYPANTDFPTAVDGIRDASAHIRDMASGCPNTRMVLGGFSQGAAVMGFVTADAIPDGISASQVPSPMSPDVANHVAAVVLFGKPSNRFMDAIEEPHIAIGPLYAPKTIDLCAPNDPICSDKGEMAAHAMYAADGLVAQGAAFAVNHL
ncbi:MAG: cutinase family protein [Mycobacteriaceae bacterium]|nr:cutinase family protein [Mycobacteriaceae bacterium]